MTSVTSVQIMSQNKQIKIGDEVVQDAGETK